MADPLPAAEFYEPYHGHSVAHLETVAARLRAQGTNGKRRGLLWLCGDSSFDNKYWLAGEGLVAARNGMGAILHPPFSPPDIAALVNALLEAEAPHLACVNVAVEESTLAGRGAALQRGAPFLSLAQDALLARSVEGGDVIVASAGGNDVVLRPALATVAALAAVLACGSDGAIDAGSAFGMGTLVALFQGQMEAYLAALTARAKPALCVAVFPYFPCARGAGWADGALSLMGYSRNPARLQRVMRAAFRLATGAVAVPGVRVLPLALFDALDAEDERDYVARVEPSARGGAKIARQLVDAVLGALGSGGGGGGGGGAPG